MIDIMTDLETASTYPNAALVSIGAVAFDPPTGEILSQVYYPISLASSVALRGHIDADTMVWWMQQSDQAREVFRDPEALPLTVALTSFSNWVNSLEEDKNSVNMWGNGATFDNVVLTSAYRSAGLPKPWGYKGDRCYRTLKNLRPDIELVRVGTHHNALDDAVSQAFHLMAILESMR